ncbi:TonB-dependent receptor domain-containing protein [Methylopila henanensis]|uniref:TonB-dependent receptor domain-containing protein n=1 Tax=Methylopila henanensis TaxID=873516 RepID=A0ABW4K584_9HYPH
MTSGHRNGRDVAARLAASLLAGAALVAPMDAKAQGAPERPFAIPAGRLGDALASYGRQAGLQLAYRPDLAAGKTTAGLTGAATPDAALRRLLAGTGLTYQLTSARTAVITSSAASADDAPDADGSLVLNPIQVTGAGGVAPADAPYVTPAPTAHISAETIERFRGSSPADIFRGTPGVMSGEARNGAGSIDVNIRGMQGMGRVAVTVDGAENAVTVYQGYQGVSNRTFVDPDLLASVDILKGADVASFGTAGTVSMRTLDAGDIVQEGRDYGVRVKGGFGTNTTKPNAGSVAGYGWPRLPGSTVTTPSSDGMDRPAFLEPASGSGSAVAAVKQENYDLVAGFAYRKQGNYFAGENGPGAKPVNVGPRRICNSVGYCQDWPEYVENGGIANYRKGEEVLNTQLETMSWIAKGTLRFGDGQSLQLGYTGFRGEAGDRIASRLTDDRGQAVQQAQTSGSDLDTGTLRYRWNPDDNDLINLKANLWWSRLDLRNPLRTGFLPPKKGDFRAGSNTDMWGSEVTNTSVLPLSSFGSVDVTYGLSYRGEDTRPSPGTREAETWLDYRDGRRHEGAGFVKSAWKPLDWLTFNGGLRYSHFWSEDRNDPYLPRDYDYDAKLSDGGFSPSVGVTVEPIKGAQLFVNYSSALRAPSIMESVSAFTMGVNAAVKPERSRNWEVGANLVRDGLFADGDKGMVKLSYFNWDVKDYISREWRQAPEGWWGMQIHNIDRARFSGLEFSGKYEVHDFTAELTANYYLNVEFCRTAGACGEKSLYADYSTNQVPPEYSLSLTASQKFWETLTVGGRLSHVGPRAIGHGDATAQGASTFIALVDWKAYTLVDVFAQYKINKYLTADFRVENLTDKYYVDPLGLVLQPGPGRTFYASMTATF